MSDKAKVDTSHVNHESLVDGARKAKKLNAAGLWPPKMVMGREVIWNHKAGREATPEEVAKALAAPLVEGEVVEKKTK